MKIRTGTGVVEAVQFSGNFDEIEEFVGGDAEVRDGKLLVATPHGPLYASNGDWIVRDEKGTFRALSPGLFKTTHTSFES